MDETKALEILKGMLREDDSLYDLTDYVYWKPENKSITLDSTFEFETLEAIVWWMKNKSKI